MNVGSFIIERKGKGNSFQTIGTIRPQPGNSLFKLYSFNDDVSGIKDERLYYRLRIADLDGSVTYSDTKMVDIAKGELITLLPNPVSQTLIINGKGNLFVQIYNSEGLLMYSKLVSEANRNIDVSRFSKGIYLFNIKDQKGNIYVKKVIVN